MRSERFPLSLILPPWTMVRFWRDILTDSTVGSLPIQAILDPIGMVGAMVWSTANATHQTGRKKPSLWSLNNRSLVHGPKLDFGHFRSCVDPEVRL